MAAHIHPAGHIAVHLLNGAAFDQQIMGQFNPQFVLQSAQNLYRLERGPAHGHEGLVIRNRFRRTAQHFSPDAANFVQKGSGSRHRGRRLQRLCRYRVGIRSLLCEVCGGIRLILELSLPEGLYKNEPLHFAACRLGNGAD
ncbi:hypothetical protein D3C75_259570 [compost metagenome]